jgi:addiction module HigA family antidote
MTKYRIMNQTTPAESSPPGRILQRDLEALEVSHADAARKLRLNTTELEALLTGQLPITQAVAERIAEAFGGRTEFWLESVHQFDLFCVVIEG